MAEIKKIVGYSIEKRPLEISVFGNAPRILILGGVHADEVEGIGLANALIGQWKKNFPFKKTGAVVFPCVNPDGYALKQRQNANGVDLNRNLPTADWTAAVLNPRYPPGPTPMSESENKALVQLIQDLNPIAILSLHSYNKVQVNSNGPAREWAKRLSQVCGYPVTEDIGYPTPGSLGTYAGKERGIPTITLEIERGLALKRVLEIHLPTVHEAILFWENQQG